MKQLTLHHIRWLGVFPASRRWHGRLLQLSAAPSTVPTLPAALLLMPCRSLGRNRLGARLDSLPAELAEVCGSGLSFGGDAHMCLQLDGLVPKGSGSTVRRLMCKVLQYNSAACAPATRLLLLLLRSASLAHVPAHALLIAADMPGAAGAAVQLL